jgi:hypothetical protein
VAVTLPEDVIAALRATDSDVGRAIVALVNAQTTSRRPAQARQTNIVDTATTGRRQSLIVVDPKSFPALPGCALMRIADDRAFIALAPGARLADLEVAVIDRIADPQVPSAYRVGLLTLRRALRHWRTNPRVSVIERAIVVLEGDVRRARA